MKELSELAGKVALVTGGSRKLGAAVAGELARHGVNVAVNYLHAQEAAEKLCRELGGRGARSLAVAGDVTSEDQVAALVERTWAELGPIDILVNNVGTYADAPLLEIAPEAFDQVMATNVRSTYLLTRSAGARMKERGQGVVINIGAADALHRSHSVYGLAKLGVAYLTQALALELAPEVRCNAVAPDLMQDNEDLDPDSEFARGSLAATPLGRLVRRAEIAEVIALLCTSSFAFVTGQVIGMDGGRSISRIRFG
jgi:3-oxoacyl-[acyl-carrier protein] reductase